jgi:nucleoside-diphosphate-sugar epimerase
MILQVSGVEPLKKRVPAWAAIMISHMVQAFHKIFIKDQEPMLTPFIVSELIRSHWFDINKARRLLDYNPGISNIEGLRKMTNIKQK